MGIPDFRAMREQCELIRAQKNATFPINSVVAVDSESFHGVGLVTNSDCPLEQLPVLVQSGNVWWYPLEDCKPHAGKMPSWLRGYMRQSGLIRTRPTAHRNEDTNGN